MRCRSRRAGPRGRRGARARRGLLLGPLAHRRCAGEPARATRPRSRRRRRAPCSSAMANASLQARDRLLGLAEQELEPAEVVQQPADVQPVGQLLVLRLRPLGVRAGEHPVPVALGDQRGLEVGLAERARVVHRLGELERARDVVARGLVVALAAVAARAPREHVRAQQVGRERRAVGERERLAEERDRGRDARDQVAADAEPEEHLGAVEIGERRALDEAARLLEQVDRGPDLAALGARPSPRPTARAPGARPRRCATTAASASRVLVDRLVVVAALEQRLGARQDRLGPRALVARDAAREERRRRRRAGGEPLDRLAGRLRLAALDLRDVLLREAVAARARSASARRRRAAGAGARRGAIRAGRGGSAMAASELPRPARELIRGRSIAVLHSECNPPIGTCPPKGAYRLRRPLSSDANTSKSLDRAT